MGLLLALSIYIPLKEQIDVGLKSELGVLAIAGSLSEWAGTGPSLAAIAFLAYIIGVIWAEIIPPCAVWVIDAGTAKFFDLQIRWRHWRTGELLDKLAERENRRYDDRTQRVQLTQIFVNTILRLRRNNLAFRTSWDEIVRDLPRPRRRSLSVMGEEEEEAYSRSIEIASFVDTIQHVNEISDDMTNVPARLLSRKPQAWSTWDRLRSESEFRKALATALVPFILALWWQSSSEVVLLGLAGAVTLWLVGLRKESEANRLLLETVRADPTDLVALSEIEDPGQLHWIHIREGIRLSNRGTPEESRVLPVDAEGSAETKPLAADPDSLS